MAFYSSSSYNYQHPGHRYFRGSQFHQTPRADYRREELQHADSYNLFPAAQISAYDYGTHDAYRRTERPFCSPQPAAPEVAPMSVPVAEHCTHPRGSRTSSCSVRRSQVRDGMIGEIAEMALIDAVRSRSRAISGASLTDRSDSYQWDREEKDKELRERQQAHRWEEKAELGRFREQNQKIANQERIISEYEETKRKEAEAAKAEEIRIKEKIEREQREAEEKEKNEYERFLLKLSKTEAEKKAKGDEEKERVDQEMKRRLMSAGCTDAQIEFLLDEGRQKKPNALSQSRRGVVAGSVLENRGPVYAKIRKDYLSVDTLLYFDIPYQVDEGDSNYIIILRELDKSETDVLFEHTRRLRAGKLLLDPPNTKQYAWFRMRDGNTRKVRKIGIFQAKKGMLAPVQYLGSQQRHLLEHASNVRLRD